MYHPPHDITVKDISQVEALVDENLSIPQIAKKLMMTYGKAAVVFEMVINKKRKVINNVEVHKYKQEPDPYDFDESDCYYVPVRKKDLTAEEKVILGKLENGELDDPWTVPMPSINDYYNRIGVKLQNK